MNMADRDFCINSHQPSGIGSKLKAKTMIYVDDLRKTEKTKRFPFTWGCHLLADSQEELYDFARNVMWIPAYKMLRSPLPHYDLSPAQRRIAINNGAIDITEEQVKKKIQEIEK